jgi:hypothetical protein
LDGRELVVKPTLFSSKVGFLIYEIKNKDGRHHQPGTAKNT